jgi:hypothetical protein
MDIRPDLITNRRSKDSGLVFRTSRKVRVSTSIARTGDQSFFCFVRTPVMTAIWP